ncbi:uncharacterized protein DS421_20g692160 [Arachis hypogaea]|nr:uncharacterized protein DS421_20g692160 [Arachis hypogaea]
MENLDSFFINSQDPSNDHRFDEGLKALTNPPLDTILENGMNLELNIEMPPPQHLSQIAHGGGDVTENNEKVLVTRLLNLDEGIEHKVADVDDRIAKFETKSEMSEGMLLRILEMTQRHYEDHHKIVMVPKPNGEIARGKVVDVESYCGYANVPDQNTQLSGHVGKLLQQGSSATVKSTTEKGKAVQKESSYDNSLLDIFVPNSPFEDDVVVIEKLHSNQGKTSRISIIAFAEKSSSSHWSVGTPKTSSDNTVVKRPVPGGLQEKVAGLYRSAPSTPKAQKLPRLEHVEMTPMHSRPLLNLSRLLLTPPHNWGPTAPNDPQSCQ